ncbi:hypothetical protein EJB05_02469, partial [Eragrostis curvula]
PLSPEQLPQSLPPSSQAKAAAMVKDPEASHLTLCPIAHAELWGRQCRGEKEQGIHPQRSSSLANEPPILATEDLRTPAVEVGCSRALSIHAATTREGWHVSASSRRYSRAHRRRNDPNADSATVVVFNSFNARSASTTEIRDISDGSLVRSHDPMSSSIDRVEARDDPC